MTYYEYDYPGDEIPVIVGSALKTLEATKNKEQKILELMEAVDLHSRTRP